MQEETMNRFGYRATTLVILLACLSGCTTPTSPGGPAQSSAYTAGYVDGCASGEASQSIVAGRYKKDTQRFAADKQYAEGWTTAFDKCAYAQAQRDAAGSR
jgi:hypothetical protein